MRVIAGTARRLPLKTVPGMETRPTTDRIKETLFNMIQPYLCDCRFLDLFAGSGAIAIEALSRGAAYAVLVEQNPKACACIQENLVFTKLQKNANLMQKDVFHALELLKKEEPFDYIFMDPPYDHELEKQVLERLIDASYVSEDTTIIVETSLETEMDYADAFGFEILKRKNYKTNSHFFLRRK